MNYLKQGKIYSSSQFWRLQSIVTWLHYCGEENGERDVRMEGEIKDMI
jgi:hypothetical protein